MGVFSNVHRFREAGEAANVNNVEEFGQPVRSLFTSTEVFTLRHKIEITDANGNMAYRAQTKFPSLHDKTTIIDARGNEVAYIERKVFSMHGRHFVTMADGTDFEISNELFHLIKDVINIEGLGWQLRGNILALNFELYDENENIIAVVAQKMFSVHDKYCVDIYKPEYEKEVVAILVTLQHMIRDRQASSGADASSGSAD